jgi:hypothetical protein
MSHLMRESGKCWVDSSFAEYIDGGDETDVIGSSKIYNLQKHI